MPIRNVSGAGLHSTIVVTLLTALVVSLAYSVHSRYGHADQPIAESADAVTPLSVGQSAPRFTVRTVDGEPFVFDPRNVGQPTIFVSFRGGWCPYCNLHLSELRHVLPEIRALGVEVYFLSGDRPEILYSSLKNQTQEDIDGLDYTILSDADAQAAIAFGVAFRSSPNLHARLRDKGADIDASSMTRHGVLPVPSVYAIDRSGLIVFAYANPDYKIRLPADELLAVARDLRR